PPGLGRRRNRLGDLLGPHPVGLVDHYQAWRRPWPQHRAGDVAIPRADALGPVQRQHDGVGVGERLLHRPLHPLRQPVEGLLHAREVDQHHLPARAAHCAECASPPRLQITRSSGANSVNTWRQAPHGGAEAASAWTAIASNSACPAPTAANTAFRSAQLVRPYEAFSTLTPVTTSPLESRRAAPT